MSVRGTSAGPVAPVSSSGASAGGSPESSTPPAAGDAGFNGDSGFDAGPSDASALLAGAFDDPRWKGYSQAQLDKARADATASLSDWLKAHPDASSQDQADAAKQAAGKAWAKMALRKSWLDRMLQKMRSDAKKRHDAQTEDDSV